MHGYDAWEPDAEEPTALDVYDDTVIDIERLDLERSPAAAAEAAVAVFERRTGVDVSALEAGLIDLFAAHPEATS